MGAGPPPRRTASALPCISPISPLHLHYISPISPRRVAPLLPRRRVHGAVPPRALLGRGAARRQPARHAQCTRNMHMHRCTGTRTRRVRCMRMRIRMSCGSHAHACVWMVVDPCDQSWPVAETGRMGKMVTVGRRHGCRHGYGHECVATACATSRTPRIAPRPRRSASPPTEPEPLHPRCPCRRRRPHASHRLGRLRCSRPPRHPRHPRRPRRPRRPHREEQERFGRT